MIKNIARRMECLIPGGLSVRKAALIVKAVICSNSYVIIECKSKICTIRNVLELLSMGVEYGDIVDISACGEDAEETVMYICKLLHEDIKNVFDPMHSVNLQTALA